MQRFVYYIAAHHKPIQLQRLIRTLQRSNPEAIIVLQLDSAKGKIDPRDFVGLPGVEIVPQPTSVEWGGYSQVEMNFNALSWIVGHLTFDWVLYISGQDYPLQPLKHIERFYQEGKYDGYISGVPLDSGLPCDPVGCPQTDKSTTGTICADCSSRYYYRYYDISTLNQIAERMPVIRRFYRRFKIYATKPGGGLRMRSWLGPDKSKTLLGIHDRQLFTNGFRCYKGFAWFALNHHAVTRMLAVLKESPRIAAHFRRTLLPDEALPQTLLYNQADLSICSDNQRFSIWEDCHAPHPTTLTAEHYDQLVPSGKHFARKFDLLTDEKIFDLLDRRLFGN